MLQGDFLLSDFRKELAEKESCKWNASYWYRLVKSFLGKCWLCDFHYLIDLKLFLPNRTELQSRSSWLRHIFLILVDKFKVLMILLDNFELFHFKTSISTIFLQLSILRPLRLIIFYSLVEPHKIDSFRPVNPLGYHILQVFFQLIILSFHQICSLNSALF